MKLNARRSAISRTALAAVSGMLLSAGPELLNPTEAVACYESGPECVASCAACHQSWGFGDGMNCSCSSSQDELGQCVLSDYTIICICF